MVFNKTNFKKGENMDKQQLNRYFFYTLGVILLSAGITLNTKTALGVSPLISLPYSVSQIWDLSFPAMTFILYSFFVALQFILKGKNRQLKDLLQIPLSIVFSLFLDIFSDGYDMLISISGLPDDSLFTRVILLIIAVPMTGVGASMMISMNLIPNPADGLAQTVGEVLGKGLGFGKNFIDFSSVAVTALIGIIASGHLVGIGIGTIIGMVGVGRCIAAFNHFFHNKLMLAIGRNHVSMSLE